jgi:hypothetical protein
MDSRQAEVEALLEEEVEALSLYAVPACKNI